MPNESKLVREAPLPSDVEAAVVVLGDVEYRIVPQRIGHLRTQLGLALGNLEGLQLESANVLDLLGQRAYAVLKAFVPDVMPEWEFHGYATRETWEAGDYNPEYDRSPTPPQLREAFTVASRLNEIDLVKHLGKLIGPEILQGFVAGLAADTLDKRRSEPLPNSSPESTDTPSTTSGPQNPTSVSGDGSGNSGNATGVLRAVSD
jgi:hypothetical protein